MLLTPNSRSLVAITLGRDEPNLGEFWPLGGAKNIGSLYLLNDYTDFYEIWSYDVGPILRPYLEGGHDWSMSAWLITTNPNRHTFSLLHFRYTFPLQQIPRPRRWPVSSLLPLARHPLGPTSVGYAVRGVRVARGGLAPVHNCLQF